jgi:SAM-dependent methyltransferase
MKESEKTKGLWGDFERNILQGHGIDIGCGDAPIVDNVKRFDMEDGDANEITKYVNETFDFVFSSHCLEHMKNPREAILEWWSLVKPGGHLIFLVPDEDLYEQGVFPSRFNTDHKFTFTISKQKSWSPVSINVLDLVQTLPKGKIISLLLQDQGYNRQLSNHGNVHAGKFLKTILRTYRSLKRKLNLSIDFFDKLLEKSFVIDQTTKDNVVAQIQCIMKKEI